MDQLSRLGIELGSVFFYLVSTGVLLAILTHYFYAPLMKIVDERREKIAGSIEESNRLRLEFEKTLQQAKEDRDASEERLRAELAGLKKFTEEERAKLIAEMEEARARMLQEAQEEINQKKKDLLKDAEKEVMSLMSKIILEIVQNKVPETLINQSIQDAWKQYSQ